MRTARIPENSTFSRDAIFFDIDGVRAIPNAVRYRVDCLTTGQAVQEWATVTPADRVTLVFNQVHNAILGCNDYERRQCVVEATDVNGNTQIQDFEWEVRNLQGVE